MQEGFVDVAALIPDVGLEIRYATPHNLTGHPLAGYKAGKAVLTYEAATALQSAATKAEFYPQLNKADLFPLGYIARRSGHSRGSTVDLTLTRNGVPVDMGTGFDWMCDQSHHGTAGLTEEQRAHRAILCGVMAWAGFAPYENEWWHYRLMSEPYPDTYFDFDIE